MFASCPVLDGMCGSAGLAARCHLVDSVFGWPAQLPQEVSPHGTGDRYHSELVPPLDGSQSGGCFTPIGRAARGASRADAGRAGPSNSSRSFRVLPPASTEGESNHYRGLIVFLPSPALRHCCCAGMVKPARSRQPIDSHTCLLVPGSECPRWNSVWIVWSKQSGGCDQFFKASTKPLRPRDAATSEVWKVDRQQSLLLYFSVDGCL
jgi:hypothetical protein